MKPTTIHPVTRWARAFRDEGVFASSKYNVSTDGREARFHGNRVAWRDDAGTIFVYHQGYGLSATTRERCNTLFATLGSPYYYVQYSHRCVLALTTYRQQLSAEDEDVLSRGPVPVCGPLGMLAYRAAMRATA